MWIFTRYGFFSIAVSLNAGHSEVMVRARSRTHLENLKSRFSLLAALEIQEWPHRDYRFRLITSKTDWVTIASELAKEQKWSNFKSEVAKHLSTDSKYKKSLHEVWEVMRQLQASKAPSTGEGSRSVLDEPQLPDLHWDGIIKPETLSGEGVKLRNDLAAAAKKYDWPTVLSILSKSPELVNSTRPGGTSLYTPLHQAAHGGATVEVVSELLRVGSWRTLKNAKGNRPIDIACARSHSHLREILEPVYCQSVSPAVIARLQEQFHLAIRQVIQRLDPQPVLRLPELEVMLEYRPRKFWFSVPGMYGGFSYWLVHQGCNVTLQSLSWCRLEGGAANHHEITTTGSSTKFVTLW